MQSKKLVILLVAVLTLVPLLCLFLGNNAYALRSTATAKCLYGGQPGDCGSCTCEGRGHNGVCGGASAGCYFAGIFIPCHDCNIPANP